MDLVDEDQRAPSHPAVALGVGHHGFDFLDAAEHGAEWNVVAMREARYDSCQRGFTNARRTPKNNRTELIPLDLHPQRFPGSQDMLLSDEFFQRFRTHPFSQWALAVVLQAGQWVRFEQAHTKVTRPPSFA